MKENNSYLPTYPIFKVNVTGNSYYFGRPYLTMTLALLYLIIHVKSMLITMWFSHETTHEFHIVDMVKRM